MRATYMRMRVRVKYGGIAAAKGWYVIIVKKTFIDFQQVVIFMLKNLHKYLVNSKISSTFAPAFER